MFRKCISFQRRGADITHNTVTLNFQRFYPERLCLTFIRVKITPRREKKNAIRKFRLYISFEKRYAS